MRETIEGRVHLAQNIPLDNITVDHLDSLLGIKKSVPLTCEEMARSLRVTFFPHNRCSRAVAEFADELRNTLQELGVEVIPFEAALNSRLVC